MKITLPDSATDPGGFVIAVSWMVSSDAVLSQAPITQKFLVEQIALWRGLVVRHVRDIHGVDPGSCFWCRGLWPCPDLLAVVAACWAYVDGVR